jgi:hypothetical protein
MTVFSVVSMQSGYKEELKWTAQSEESSFETPVCRVWAWEHMNWTESRIITRNEFNCDKKTSCVISSSSETVLSPLLGYD